MRSWLVSESDSYVYGERAAALVRWAVVSLALLLNNLTETTMTTVFLNGLLLVVAALNLALTSALWRGFRPRRWFCRLSMVVDILFLTAVIFLRGGSSSTVFVLYFPVIFSAAIRFGLWESFLYAAVIDAVYAGTVLAAQAMSPGGLGAWGPLDWAQLAIRLLVFAATAGVGGMLAEREQTMRAQRTAGERLVEETQRRLLELTILQEINQTILQNSANLRQILEDIAEIIQQRLGYETLAIFLLQEEAGGERAVVFFSGSKRPKRWFLPLGEGIGGQVAQTGVAMNIRDVAEHPRYVEMFPNVRAELCVPLQIEGRVLGVIDAASSHVAAFDDDDQRLLGIIAGQTAVAVENAYLFTESQRQVAELATLNQIGQALAFVSQWDDLLELIYRQTSRVMNTSNFYIALYDETEEKIWFPLAIKEGQPQQWRTYQGKLGPAEYVAHTRKPLLILRDVDRRFQELGLEFPGQIPSAWLGVPMLAGDRVLGVIAVYSYEPTMTYDEGNQRVLVTIATQAAVALENTRLYDEISRQAERAERRARELSTLYAVGQVITSSLDPDTVLDRIMHQAVDLLEVEAGSLMLVDAESKELVFRIALGDKSDRLPGLRLAPGTGIAGLVAESGQSLCVNDAQHDARFYRGTDTLSGFETRAILAVPLRSRDQTIGVIEVMNRADGEPFLPEHLDLLTAFAAQAAIAIENAQLYQRTDKALARRVDELTAIAEVDHQLAATLDFETVNDLVIEWAIRSTEASAGLVAVLDETGTGLLLLAQSGYPPAIRRYQFEPWPVDQGITGRAVRTGEPALALDVHQDADYAEVIAETRSQLSVPIVREGQVIGVVTVESEHPAAFTPDDLRFVQHLAEHASIAMQNARLFSDLQRANRELKAVSDAKTEFVSIVAHELRAPMTSIKGYVDLVLEDEAISDEVREFLSVVQENTDRLTKLVADLLDISRIEAGRIRLSPQSVCLPDVVDSVMATAAAELQEKQLAVAVSLPGDLPPVWGDQDRVTQILTNLVNNAMKYTPAGSVRVAAILDDGFVQVTVADTGIGIASADLDRLFDKFYRADHPQVRKVPGTGLGLSIVKSLVEMQGGQVWVESQLDEGSAFHFTLPVVADSGPQATDGG